MISKEIQEQIAVSVLCSSLAIQARLRRGTYKQYLSIKREDLLQSVGPVDTEASPSTFILLSDKKLLVMLGDKMANDLLIAIPDFLIPAIERHYGFTYP